MDETVTIMKNEAKHFMNERAKRLQAAKEKRANEKKNNKVRMIINYNYNDVGDDGGGDVDADFN